MRRRAFIGALVLGAAVPVGAQTPKLRRIAFANAGSEAGVRALLDAFRDELRAKGVKLLDEKPRIGHGGSRIAFLDPKSTANVLVELAELPAGH